MIMAMALATNVVFDRSTFGTLIIGKIIAAFAVLAWTEVNMSNRLVHIAKQLLIINDDIQFRFDFSKDNRRITVDDFELHIFEQTWGSTALGFGGVGGQAITNEYTYVFVPITCDQNCFVYFGGKYAYQAEYNSVFRDDLASCRMKPCNQAGHYTKKYRE